MKKVLKVVWTENAVQDLLIIKDFISQDSEAQAEKWILELYNLGESLTELSSRGRIVPEFNQENLRELITVIPARHQTCTKIGISTCDLNVPVWCYGAVACIPKEFAWQSLRLYRGRGQKKRPT